MSNINKYLPKVLQEVLEFKTINGTLDTELSAIDEKIKNITSEVIVQTATEYGISKWEKSLGITYKQGETLDVRRFRIQNTLTNKLPYTYRWLVNKLTEITGSSSGFIIDMDYENYEITITLSGLNTDIMAEVQRQLRVAVPANMELLIATPSLSETNIKVGVGLMYATKYFIGSNYTV